MGKPEMNYQQLIDVGLSEDFNSFERRLVATADALGFPIISGVLMRGLLQDAGKWRAMADAAMAAGAALPGWQQMADRASRVLSGL